MLRTEKPWWFRVLRVAPRSVVAREAEFQQSAGTASQEAHERVALSAAVPQAPRESQDLVRSLACAACCSKLLKLLQCVLLLFTVLLQLLLPLQVLWSCLLSLQLLFRLLHLRTPAVPLLEHWCSITVLVSQEGSDLQQMFCAVAGLLVVEPPLQLFNLLHVTYLCTPLSPAVLC